MKKIILIGNGGHSSVIQDIIEVGKEYQIVAILDSKYTKVDSKEGIEYAPITYILELLNNNPDSKVVIAIGNNKIRQEVVEELGLPNQTYATCIHPKAIIAQHVAIGHGTVIMPGAIINAHSTIQEHCIINTSSVIEHHNQIESFAHISPQAGLAGNVTVRKGAQIGIGAHVIGGITIGEWSKIGAGSAVIHNIPNNCTAVGVPARPTN